MELRIDKDKLYPRAALHRLGMTDEQIDAAVTEGRLCQRAQFGVEELWVDGQPHMRATRFSRPRKDHHTLPTPTVSGGATLPVKPKKAAPAKKQEQPKEVLSLGLGF